MIKICRKKRFESVPGIALPKRTKKLGKRENATSMFGSRFRDPWIFLWNGRSASFLRAVIAYLVWGIPYLMPTPTRGSALIIFFTVAWSENANKIEAVDKKVLKDEL